MSADQASSGPAGSKSRSRRFYATGRLWLESVVRTNRFGAFARIPRPFMSFATMFSEHAQPPPVQLRGHPRTAVAALDLDVNLFDHAEQRPSSLSGGAFGPSGPGVVATDRHLQGVAYPGRRPLRRVVGAELEGQLGCSTPSR